VDPVPIPVVLVCPCCASPVDALAHVTPQSTQLFCAACQQNWLMVVDAKRLAEFSLT
jgi:hypothetical protein